LTITVNETEDLEVYKPMKTRIISGVLMALIVVFVLLAGFTLSPIVITAFVAIIAAIGCYELTSNAAGIKSRLAVIGSAAFCFLFVFSRDTALTDGILFGDLAPAFLSTIYCIFAAFCVLKNHKDFTLAHIGVLCAMPIVLGYAFSTLGLIISETGSIYYLLLLFNFSSVCDMGAYFVGVTMGKHKLCPNISPKKTVEGAVGGIASSVIVSLILTLAFSKTDGLILTLIFTIPLCVLGMIGDLFASSIKRAVGLKDYGSLIPGHGGILDRVDSILMIAPLLYLLITVGVL